MSRTVDTYCVKKDEQEEALLFVREVIDNKLESKVA